MTLTTRQKRTELELTSQYVVDSDRRLVIVRFSGEVTVSKIERYAVTLRTHPDFKPDFAEIVDLTQATELNLDAQDFLRLADEIDPFSAQSKRAFVVGSLSQKHAVRMHRALRTTKNIEFFRTFEDAETWIRFS